MLRIIYGESGTGKSTLLYKMINEEAEKGKKVFLFVPDQFSFEAEKNVYKTVKPPYGMNVTVTMFSKAAQKILQLYGETKPYADDVVKAMLMKRTINALAAEERIVYYRRQLKNPTFPKLMLNIISQLRGGGITPSGLRNRISDFGDDFSETLTGKLNDISEVYTEYDRLLTVNFDDKLDDVRRAAQLVTGDDYFKDSVCFFDCFDEFSGSQYEFIKAVAMRAEKAVFTATADDISSEEQHFRGTVRLITKLKELVGGDETEYIKLDKRYRSCNLCEIIKAGDMWQECDWICSEIHNLLDEGYRCREIAVLMPDNSYGRILESAMKKYDIPAFVDIPEPLINKGVIRFIIYTLQALSFETEDILRYVKSGFVRNADGKTISDIQLDMLEALCRCYDLRKRDWLKPFHEKLHNGEKLEELRKTIIEPLKKLKKAFENTDGAEMTEQLCLFLRNDVDIERSLYDFYLDSKRGDDGAAVVYKKKQDEYSAIWEEAVEIFESAHEALKGLKLTLKEYTEMLTDIFTQTHIAKPPQVLDAVTVGDVERSRFNRVRAVFICGMNQGVFPKSTSAGGNFTAFETEQLALCGITIGDDRISRSSAEHFKLYRCTNLPEDRLFITYPVLSDSLSEFSPSPFIENLKIRFSASVKGADDYGADFYCRTEKSARRYLARIYSDYDRKADRKAALKAVSEQEYTALLQKACEGIGERRLISPQYAEVLLKKKGYSPSAIDTLNQCRFRYFCDRGLRLDDEGKREMGSMLTGNVVHYCLERLLTDYMGKAEEFSALTDEKIRETVELYIKEYLENELIADFGGSERFSYQVKRLSALAVPAAVNVRDGIRNGSFFPVAIEQEVDFRFGDIDIFGVCDRYDISETEKGRFLRIIDYKRKKNKVPTEDIYKGKNLQMLLYLFGLCEKYEAQPSSVLYQPIGEYKKKTADTEDMEKAEASVMRANADKHKANGIMLEGSPDEEEAAALAEYYEETYGKKRGGYVTPQIISKSSFESMKNYCKAYVNALVQEAAMGMISACPKDEVSCSYCEYKLFCGHEIKEEEDSEDELD